MKRVYEKDLIKSEEFVEKPVEKKINEILSSDKRRIILAGNRGTGRSVVLCALENKGIGKKEQTILMSPDSVIFLQKEPSEKYNEELFDYIYGMRFTNSILWYVKNRYPITYEKYFKEDKEELDRLISEFDEQLNKHWFEDVVFTTNKEPKEILRRAVYKIYETLNVEKLNIAIDRFDKINGSSEYAQKVYERNFDLFDKTILVTNDKHLDKKRLINLGYDIQKVRYGKNKEVLREIIKRRLSKDKSKRTLYTQDIFIDKLTKQGDNISFSFDILEYVDELLNWYEKDNDIEELIDEAIVHQKNENKKLRKVMTKTKLYL